MSVIPFILAAGSLPALIFGAPVPSLPYRDVAEAASIQSFQAREASTAYTVFGGTGLISDGWPSINDWVSSFDDMFTANKEVMSSSCSTYSVANNSDDEIDSISSAIKSVASSTGVDARFILAIVMQESNGCVRVPTTKYDVVNPGLMQSHAGTGTCNSGSEVSNPCTIDQITQMITDGTAGTPEGPGLKDLLTQADASDGTQYYIAARMYNSGSVASGGNLGQGIATHCYASDVANRLLGWSSGASSCSPDGIGELTAAASSFVSGNDGSSSTSSSSVTTTASATSTVAPTTSVTPTTSSSTTVTEPSATATPVTTAISTTIPTVPAATTMVTSTATATATAVTTPSPSSSASSPDPVYPEAISSCTKYTTVTSGDYCVEVENETGITASQFVGWNPGLDAACSNLWLGYQYCIQA